MRAFLAHVVVLPLQRQGHDRLRRAAGPRQLRNLRARCHRARKPARHGLAYRTHHDPTPFRTTFDSTSDPPGGGFGRRARGDQATGDGASCTVSSAPRGRATGPTELTLPSHLLTCHLVTHRSCAAAGDKGISRSPLIPLHQLHPHYPFAHSCISTPRKIERGAKCSQPQRR